VGEVTTTAIAIEVEMSDTAMLAAQEGNAK
jgi:hypothetical protein